MLNCRGLILINLIDAETLRKIAVTGHGIVDVWGNLKLYFDFCPIIVKRYHKGSQFWKTSGDLKVKK